MMMRVSKMKDMETVNVVLATISLLLIFCIIGGCVQNETPSSQTSSSSTQQESLTKSLIKDLKNSTMKVRMNAAANLGDTGDKSAVIPLIEVLNSDTEGRIRAYAAESLGKIKDERAVEPLIVALKDDKYFMVRSFAAASLGEIKDERAFDPLITALKDEHMSVRSEAATALGKIGDKRAISPLVETLGDPFVYKESANALGMIGEPAVDPCIEALKGPGEKGAIIALGLIGDKRATEPLIEIMKEKHLNEIPEALGKIKDKRSVQPLVEQIPVMKTFNGSTLSEIGYRKKVVSSLGAIGPDAKDAVPALLEMVQNPAERPKWYGDVDVITGPNTATVGPYSGRVGAILESIEALGNIGDNRAIPVLETLVNDSDPEIKDRAGLALKKIKG